MQEIRKSIYVMFGVAGLVIMVSGCKQKQETVKSISQSTKSEIRAHDSLAPHGEKYFNLQISKNGSVAFKILIPDNPDTIDKKAADMLKDALKKGTGIDFDIVKGKDYTSGPVISIGETVLYKKSGIKPQKSLDLDGYMIAEKSGNIFLIGGSRRGAISPVMALVEEDFGGRLYTWHDGLQIPQLPEQKQIVLREYVPTIKVRTMFQAESFNKDFQLFNRVGSSTSGYDYVPKEWGGTTCWPKDYFVHTMMKIFPNSLYDKHPEYFALIDGERMPQGNGGGAAAFCLTNPDARKIAIDNILKEVKKYHQYHLFSVSLNDTQGMCQCDKCQAIVKRTGSKAGPLLDFVNVVAERVKKEYPDVTLTTLAYNDSSKAPKGILPDNNVMIRLCTDKASYYYPLYPVEEIPSFMKRLDDWGKAGSKIFIWDYVVDYKAWPMPRPNLEVIGKNIDLFAERGIYGIFLQSSHYGPGENQGRLRAWVYAKKLWDPSRKMDDLIRDFNYGYFGKAGSLMQEYSDLLKAEGRKFHDSHNYKESADYPLKFSFSDEFYPKARAIFDKALKLTADDKALHEKVEFEYVSILFYRLQMMPPQEGADRESYIADLNKFKELTEKYDVKWISEKTTKTKQRIVEWKRKYNIVSADDKPVTVHLGNSDISRIGDGATRMDDISAPGGQCAKIPIRGKAWAVQWFFGSALFRDVDYMVRIQIRADKKRKNGPAFVSGIYSVSEKKVPLHRTIDASEIADGGYHWLNIGNINGSDAPSAYFYIAQIQDSAISDLYISAIELIPEGEENYKKIAIPKRDSDTSAVVKKGKNGEIIFPATSAKLLGVAKRKGDAVALSPTSKEWNVKWRIGNNLPVGKYNVRAQIKISGQKAGYGLRMGLYSPLAKKEWFRVIKSVENLPVSQEYQWVEIGVADIPAVDPNAYLFTCSLGDNSFDSLLVKTIEFKSIAGDGSAMSKPVSVAKPASPQNAANIIGANKDAISFTADTAIYRGEFRRIDGAMSVPPTSKAWDGKWKLGNKLPVGKYNVRAYVKVTGPRAGFGIRFGTYSKQAKKSWLNFISPVTGMTSGKYQWIDLGVADVTANDPDAYLFVCSGGDNSFDSFLVKAVEFNIVK